MRSNHQLSLPPMEAKALVPARTIVGPLEGQAVVLERTNGLSLLIGAVSESGCSEKEAAHSLGCPDQTYWSKVKSGDKPAPRIDKLTALPEPAQREYVKRWGKQLGMRVSDEDTRTRVLADVVEA